MSEIITSLEKYKWEIEGVVTKINIQDEQLLIDLENEIKNNFNENLNYVTNVKGKMTHWDYFKKNNYFKKLLKALYTSFHEEGYWLPYFNKRKNRFETVITNAWGNCLTKDDKVLRHHHLGADFASVLYFDDYAPLCTDAGEFKTKRGLILTLPSYMFHWVNPIDKDITRYTLAWNWSFNKEWDNLNQPEVL
jgi:hypothetical protein